MFWVLMKVIINSWEKLYNSNEYKCITEKKAKVITILSLIITTDHFKKNIENIMLILSLHYYIFIFCNTEDQVRNLCTTDKPYLQLLRKHSMN